MAYLRAVETLSELSAKLVGTECTSELHALLSAHNYNPMALSPKCREDILRTGLSYGLVAGAALVRLPQLLKVTCSRDARGLSFLGTALETAVAGVAVAGNWRAGRPFGLWGESAFGMVFGWALMVAIGLLGGERTVNKAAAIRRPGPLPLLLVSSVLAVSLAFATTLFLPGYLSAAHLARLQALVLPCLLVARLPQLWTLLRTQTPGQLSMVSVALQTGGSVARLWTTWKGVAVNSEGINEWLATGGAAAALNVLLNSLLLVLILVFGSSKRPRPIRPAKVGKDVKAKMSQTTKKTSKANKAKHA